MTAISRPARSAPVVVRRARPSDVEACARIVAADNLWRRYGITLVRARRALRDGLGAAGRALAVAARGSEVVGFVLYRLEGTFHHSGYIRWIAVAPHARGQGIGADLMRFAESQIFKRGPNIFLMVSDFNSGAQAFYRALGYSEVGAIGDYIVTGVTERLYRKTIGPIGMP